MRTWMGRRSRRHFAAVHVWSSPVATSRGRRERPMLGLISMTVNDVKIRRSARDVRSLLHVAGTLSIHGSEIPKSKAYQGDDILSYADMCADVWRVGWPKLKMRGER